MKTREAVYQKRVNGNWVFVGRGYREVPDDFNRSYHFSRVVCCRTCGEAFLKLTVMGASFYIDNGTCSDCEETRFPVGSLSRLTNHWFSISQGLCPDITGVPDEVLIDELLYQQGVVDHVQHYTDSRITANTNPFADRFISADPDRSASNY